jgi:hypothetical protein
VLFGVKKAKKKYVEYRRGWSYSSLQKLKCAPPGVPFSGKQKVTYP